jgi:hypothetical protein
MSGLSDSEIVVWILLAFVVILWMVLYAWVCSAIHADNTVSNRDSSKEVCVEAMHIFLAVNRVHR